MEFEEYNPNKRYATVPNIFGLREWFWKFNHHSYLHDKAYYHGYLFGGCKTCEDLIYAYRIAKDGHVITALVTFFVLLIWVPKWIKWVRKTSHPQ